MVCKKLVWVAFLFISFIITSNAQVKVNGLVKDNRGRPLKGVSISLKNTYDGGITDSLGKFSFKTYEKGKLTIEATFVNYKSAPQTIELVKEPVSVTFIMKELVNELAAVTVTAGSFEAGDKKRAATVMSSLDMVTTAGSNGDITAALKTLPGAQQIGDQEGLFVRGGAGYETKQFIDGTLVNNPYYTSVPDLAQRGRFSPFLFKGTVFTTGGYSALYGQALSSALILESIDLPERSEADASISSVFVGAGLQHLGKSKKSSYGINYGYTNLLPYFKVVKQRPDYFTIPEFHSFEGNFRIKTKKGIIKYYGTLAHNQLGIRRPNIDSSTIKNAFGLKNTNWYNNLSWREDLGNRWKMNLGLSYSTNLDNINQHLQDLQNNNVTTGIGFLDTTNFTLDSRQDLSQVKAVFEKKLSGISAIRFGGEYWYAYNKNNYNHYDYLLKDQYKALFAESDVYLTNALAAKIGARFEHSSIINKANIAPRVSIAYKTGKEAQMSLAYGVFYQKPENLQLQYTTNLGYTKATHYIANYIKTTNARTFRVEAFYKQYQDLVKTNPVYNNDGDGFAQGIEIFWRDKKTIKDFDYWVSYSYLDTKRNYLNFPEKLQPSFAATHTASIVAKKFITKWKTGFNATYSYATGRPYYNLAYSNTTNKYTISDSGYTTPYSSLGFSVNWLPNLGLQKKKTFIVLVASVTNALNYNLIYGYNYSNNGLIKQPIRPAANQFFFIGCFLSWGVDRSQDAINNNL